MAKGYKTGGRTAGTKNDTGRVLLKNIIGLEVVPENRQMIIDKLTKLIKEGTSDEFLKVVKLIQDGEPKNLEVDINGLADLLKRAHE